MQNEKVWLKTLTCFCFRCVDSVASLNVTQNPLRFLHLLTRVSFLLHVYKEKQAKKRFIIHLKFLSCLGKIMCLDVGVQTLDIHIVRFDKLSKQVPRISY
jgi:hypothetical protein